MDRPQNAPDALAFDDPEESGEPLDPFEALVANAIDGLPDVFQAQLATVAIVVEDEPTAAQLASTGAQGLFGLYTGVPRTQPGASGSQTPNKITIFRGPHQRAFHDAEGLARGVAATVRHEVAHHLGISDARLAELAADRVEG